MKHKPCLFLRKLHRDLDTTYETLWSMLLGELVPSQKHIGVLVDHFNQLGWNVTPRDFLRGTAASNNQSFILLRLLRNSLSRSELEKQFFGIRQHKRKPRKEIDHGEENN